MGVWNETTPTGSDNAREGDDRIRELKVAIGEALSHEDSTFPGASPSTTPIYVPGFRKGNTASRPTGDSLVAGRLYINSETGLIERYNGTTWETVTTAPPNSTITEFQLATSVAGPGLTGGSGAPLTVNGDGTTIEVSGDTVRIAAGAAGSGLVGGGGSPLAANPDNSTIEISSDALRVKDGGITEAKLATAIKSRKHKFSTSSLITADTTGIGYSTVFSLAGPGALKSLFLDADTTVGNSGNANFSLRLTIDGVALADTNVFTSNGVNLGASNHSLHAPLTNPGNPPTLGDFSITGPFSGVAVYAPFYYGFATSLVIELKGISFSDSRNGFWLSIEHESAT